MGSFLTISKRKSLLDKVGEAAVKDSKKKRVPDKVMKIESKIPQQYKKDPVDSPHLEVHYQPKARGLKKNDTLSMLDTDEMQSGQGTT